MGPAKGAARLARLAVTGEAPEAVCTKPPVSHVVEPDPVLVDLYGERIEFYRELYMRLKGERS